MADDQTPETIDAPIKSATDLELEKLTARLDALESENRELRSANQGLWAQLHPVQEQPIAENPIASAIDKDYAVLSEKLGLKEE